MIRSVSDDHQKLILPDSDIRYYPAFISRAVADDYFEYFMDHIPWQQDQIRVFGKTYPQPRLTALFGTNGKAYSYSSICMQPRPFEERLLHLKELIDSISETQFTSCLLNLYRNGADSNGWHADDEKELGLNPVIASLSLGQARFFHLKHKKSKELKCKLLLEHGSLLLMQGATQHHYYHQIPKTKRPIGPRINLTFRLIK